MKRKIIAIDTEKCTGCGLCIPNCPEGAIQMIDGKARLVSDLFCDGLGACLGHCPEGAITVEEREAEPYDEKKVMANVVRHGANTIRAHLKHLKDHGETEYLKQAHEYLEENGIEISQEESEKKEVPMQHAGCPGSRAMSFARTSSNEEHLSGDRPSQLTHWPVQLHLMSPGASHYRGADMLLAADCTAFTAGDFHKDFLKGRALAIACPKLDEGQEIYIEKIRMLIDEAKINTLTVLIMQVPCCGGLLHMAQTAAAQASRKVPIKAMVLGLDGNVISDDWV
jgi:ferredoxin